MSEELANLNKKIHHEKLGGRKTRRHTEKTHKKKNVIVVGKVYANWCGHCQALKPECKKMKRQISKKKGKKHVVFVEIEESEINSKLDKLNKDHNVNVQANGYPTVFSIEGGNVEYYNGNRQSASMMEWVLKGGMPTPTQSGMPGLMNDVQGPATQGPATQGGRRKFNKYSRRRRYTEKQKKPTGLFDFLCGK
jgi:thiol-disulfide isomerase/thioredoxin